MNTRLLGLFGIVGSLIQVGDGLRLVVTGHKDIPGFRHLDTVQFLTQSLWVLGCLCVMLGLIHLRATGTQPVFRALSWMPVVGYGLLFPVLVVSLAGGYESVKGIGAVGQILAQVGTLVVAILVIAAGEWTGWRKFAPLLAVVTIPIGVILVAITELDGAFIMVNAASTAILGYAVVSASPVAQLRLSRT